MDTKERKLTAKNSRSTERWDDVSQKRPAITARVAKTEYFPKSVPMPNFTPVAFTMKSLFNLKRDVFGRLMRGCLLLAGLVAGGGGVAWAQTPASGTAAAVEGEVVLPKAKVVVPSGDRYGLKAGQVAPAPAPVAVIYLEGQFPASTNAVKTNQVQMAQKGFQFTQSVLPVQKGSYVEFPNH